MVKGAGLAVRLMFVAVMVFVPIVGVQLEIASGSVTEAGGAVVCVMQVLSEVSVLKTM
jgi:hypothetical protein